MQLFIDHITVIDCAYLCARRGLVGESWICDLTLEGALDDASMIMDFGEAKAAIKRAIDDSLDHTLLVPALAEGVSRVESRESGVEKGQLILRFHFGNNETLTHISPAQAVSFLSVSEITPDSVGSYLEEMLRAVVPATVERIRIALRTEGEGAPYYQYVHGLKKHAGNCQRIAHGHRSRIVITRNGVRDDGAARAIAARLHERYIGTASDVVGQDATHTHFAYRAPQGHYALSYPSARCHIIETDSTVECIAAHILGLLKKDAPQGSFSVRAYEGVRKGAVAEG